MNARDHALIEKIIRRPNGIVLVTGPTGSGKSSLVHLLPRLYDYQKGYIKIDGKELNDEGGLLLP